VGTLTAIRKMGYDGVEFAGYYGRTSKELRALLDDLGLKCCGTHTGVQTLMEDQLEQTIEFNAELGNRFLIVPGLPEAMLATPEAVLETANLFNELAEKVAPEGMRVGYHNHTAEFEPMNGKTAWDLFFGATKREVVMQMDVGNALQGGADAIEYVRRYPGRAATIHIKEYSATRPKAFVGDGDVDWPVLLALLEEQGGTEWYIVEYEHEGMPPLASIAECLKNLRKIGK
jgi:sugar phosphate isomerase/epimerase